MQQTANSNFYNWRLSKKIAFEQYKSPQDTDNNNTICNLRRYIYMKATDENNNVIYGKLFRNIKILAVHDSSGNNVFSDPGNVGTPANLVFALSHDNYNLLMRAEYLSTKGVDLVIAPQGENTTNEEGALVSSATLRDYVNNHTSSVTDDQIQEAVNDNKTTDKSSKNNKGGLSSLLG